MNEVLFYVYSLTTFNTFVGFFVILFLI